ncbi:hypothetical protein Pmani_024313 [Petrolisthes manimaculis]|uniref:Histidine decarboxylase n=1 Tax=Petrolisthes manimaculis TaxID=1843537 RepID=A0AAE1P834_9EUCA|nr:hypothetical protein Pmani_024313 [Petrolisthes manimaculis]
MAQKFEAFVKSDPRFEIPVARHLGMVVFRLKGENQLTEKLLKKVNSTGKLHCVPACLKGQYVIRFTVTSTHTTAEDLSRDWAIIRAIASEVLTTTPAEQHNRTKVSLKDTRKNPDFGTSLLLANSPMSPKIVNGSFAAIFDNNDVLYEFAKKLQQLKLDVQDSPGKGVQTDFSSMYPSPSRGRSRSVDDNNTTTTITTLSSPSDQPTTIKESDTDETTTTTTTNNTSTSPGGGGVVGVVVGTTDEDEDEGDDEGDQQQTEEEEENNDYDDYKTERASGTTGRHHERKELAPSTHHNRYMYCYKCGTAIAAEGQ